MICIGQTPAIEARLTKRMVGVFDIGLIAHYVTSTACKAMVQRLLTSCTAISPPNADGNTTFHERCVKERAFYKVKGDARSLVELQYAFVYTEPGTEEVR